MRSINGVAVVALLVAVVVSLPSTLAGLIPYGIDSLLSGGNAIAVPLKKKDLKRDWCVGRSMAKKVHHPGCNSTEIKSKLCYGQCMTYYIPGSKSPFCTQCVPSKFEEVEVRLSCRGGLIKRKIIRVVKKCGCRSCEYARQLVRSMWRSWLQ